MSKTVSRQYPLLIDDTINDVLLSGYIFVLQMLFKEIGKALCRVHAVSNQTSPQVAQSIPGDHRIGYPGTLFRHRETRILLDGKILLKNTETRKIVN